MENAPDEPTDRPDPMSPPEPSAGPRADAAAGGGPTATPPFGHAADTSRGAGASTDAPPGGDGHASAAFAGSQFALEMAKEWVRQHQTAALVGAFAVGAFVGALMRD